MQQLFGRRILVNVPEKKASALDSLELNKQDEDAVLREAMKLWSKLEIFAVGDECSKLQAGDLVYITTSALENAERIELDGKMKFMLSEYDAAFKW